MPERDPLAKDRTRAPLPKGAVTECLRAWSDGAPEAQTQLMSLVYGELRALAAGYLRRERANHSLEATALVHEAYLNLDLTLRTLTALDPRQGQIVGLRFFGGLSVEETAEYMAISPATVKREWATAKAFMLRELRRGGANDALPS